MSCDSSSGATHIPTMPMGTLAQTAGESGVSLTEKPSHGCRWCGKPIADLRAWMCAECSRPTRFPGYLVTGGAFVATTLLLPFILAYATYLLSTEQQQIASRQKLAEAYVAFGTTMTEFRRAAATFDVLTKVASDGKIDLPEVKKAILDFDAAFNAIGAKLGPFQEAARRSHDNRTWLLSYRAPSTPNAINEISSTWNNCFVAPYYGTSAVPYEKTYWFRIHNSLRSCTAATCPQTVAERITTVVYDIWSGTCVCERPERQRPMSWLYPAMQSLMEGSEISAVATPPGEMILAKPNPDLIAPNNAYCKSIPSATPR
jgi:hypothetical protein